MIVSEGECDIKRTKKQERDGSCTCKGRFTGTKCDECKEGYLGTNCENCDNDFYMDKDGTCLLGQCLSLGTKRREENGTCTCNVDKKGAICDECAVEFYKDNEICRRGSCDLYGKLMVSYEKFT